MFGTEILVAPIYNQTGKRWVYLPAGVWIDYWSQEIIRGPQNIFVEEPLERLPLYIRGNALIPTCEPNDHISEEPFDLVIFEAYLLDQGKFDLHDADGDTVPDGCDNCPGVANTGQEDYNSDEVGDACCCLGAMRGNITDGIDDLITIEDLVYMVDYMFNGGPAPLCWDEAELEAPFGDSAMAIGDLVYLVDYMFNGGPAPVACPGYVK